MEWKDYLIIGLAVLVVVGPVGVHFYHKGKGPVSKGPAGEGLIDDYRRLGAAVTSVGGKALAEGAKLKKMGASVYLRNREQKQMHIVGAS